MSYPAVTPDLKKFVDSDYGKKILEAAALNGQQLFKYGKITYSLKYLISLSKSR